MTGGPRRAVQGALLATAVPGDRRGHRPTCCDQRAGSLAPVELAGPAERQFDAESADWLRRLSAGDGARRQEAEAELHARLLRIALAEVGRRSGSTPVTGPELADVANQAADDAMLAVLAKLAGFRGESRFMTWAYRFVILEVSSKLGRHYWRDPPARLDAAQWERLPDRLGIDPQQHVEAAGILAEVRRVVDEELTAHQRRIFVAIVEALAVLHIYVDLVVAGENPAERYPGVAAHLAACGPCDEDLTGLLLAVASD